MKNFLKYITAALFFSLIVFANCSEEEPEEPEDEILDEQAAKLTTGAATLKEGGVSTPDGATVLDWSALTITFSGNKDGGSYSTSGSADPTVWPSSGSWTFSNTTGTEIMRDGSVPVSLGGLSDAGVNYNFTISTSSASRTSVIDGAWEFEMAF